MEPKIGSAAWREKVLVEKEARLAADKARYAEFHWHVCPCCEASYECGCAVPFTADGRPCVECR